MPSEDALTAERLITEIQVMAGERCPHCDEIVSLIDALKSRALGSRRRPRCLTGLAEFLGTEVSDIESQLAGYFEQRACYQGALEWIAKQ
jgi:hypothetical protein